LNTSLIINKLRGDREYKEMLESVLLMGKRGRVRPLLVSGLSEGADGYFRAALTDDILARQKNVLLIFSDDREAAAASDFLNYCGIPSLKYPSKDFNFNNMTASHEFENERLAVLSRIAGYGDTSPFAVCAGVPLDASFLLALD